MSGVNGQPPAVCGRVVVLAATQHGLFLFHGDDERSSWERSGPFLPDFDVNHAAYDPRDGAIWAAANNGEARVYRSPNFGQSWDAMGSPFDAHSVWHVEPGRTERQGEVFVGVKPAALYRSADGGDTWTAVDGLNNHESRPEWWEGGGGLCLHTIIIPPGCNGRIYAGISVAGLFRSDDDGASWTPMNEGVVSFADQMPDPVVHRGVHRCVHKAVVHPTKPDVMFQQNHLGVYRSYDAGENWTSINDGLPSNFGFPIAIGAGDQPSIFVIPADGERLPIRTKGRLSVWRSDDDGESWFEAAEGLPKGEHNVLREAMATDDRTPTGVYLGSQDGVLHASVDGGTSYRTIAADLPAVRSIKIAYAV
ncbi:MAG: WD40/YVTN/BNR-like repeat-containing protein [Thermomicrobiales bacterium]